MIEKGLNKIKGKEMEAFMFFTLSLLFIVAIVLDSPQKLVSGMYEIIVSRDALITDYFELASYGAAFLNAALVLLIGMILVIAQKIPFTGPTTAALFINIGYALWGKNPLNILPILLGTWFYAKVHKLKFKRFIYTALFGTCLAPFVTEVAYIMPFPGYRNVLIAIVFGVFIGFVLVPLSVHTVSMHMGYNLFNVGFSAGILAFILVSIFRSLGIESKSVFIWKEGSPLPVVIGLYLYFAVSILFGLLINQDNRRGLRKIMKHPGRAIADFVVMSGPGATLINMGLVGMVGVTYIILIKGDFSGPVVGAIITAFGFASFGAHLRNYIPALLGVFLSTFITQQQLTTPSIQLAALFAVGVAPIGGQFGVIAGIVAGMLHAAIVICTPQMYGGLNLYNNGFSAGWVAVVMIPLLESFMKEFDHKKKKQHLFQWMGKEQG